MPRVFVNFVRFSGGAWVDIVVWAETGPGSWESRNVPVLDADLTSAAVAAGGTTWGNTEVFAAVGAQGFVPPGGLPA